MSERVVIVGAGQMGLVMADAVREAGEASVAVWGPFSASVEALKANRESSRLPGWRIPEGIHLTADEDVLGEATVLVNAIPTQFVRPVWTRLAPFISSEGPSTGSVMVVSTAKGLEIGTGRRPTEVIREVIDEVSTCVLSGPTIAAELARHQPAVMVAASEEARTVKSVHRLFGTPWLRIYESPDPLGVELAGALKNVIAIAAGICDGLDLGFNAKSALLARGLAEMARFGVAAGADSKTFFGVAGVGDLATTCFSPEGRNRACGEAIARGMDLDAYLTAQACVVEGVSTVQSVLQQAVNMDLELPITKAVGRVVFDKVDPWESIQDLMSRPAGEEGL